MAKTPSSSSLLTKKIFLAMIFGALFGIVLRLLFPENPIIETYLTDGLFHIIGTIFIASLKMVVVPLVFVSLICGVCTLSDPEKLGRLGLKTLGLYTISTALATVIAIFFAVALTPGNPSLLQGSQEFSAPPAPGFAQVITDMVPTNIVQAMSEGHMLQIIVFAIIFGLAISKIGNETSSRMIKLFNDLNQTIMVMVKMIMKFTPYGVFSLIASMTLSLGIETVTSVFKYFLVVLLVLLVHLVVIYPVMLKSMSNLSTMVFMKKIRQVQLFAFSSSSSNATLPINLETCQEKLGVHNSVASFTLPIGATLNMDGTAIIQGVATVFIAQIYGIPLSLGDYAMVVFMATLASIGTAGVPGVGLIMLSVVLNQVGLPVEGIALIIGVERLLDMARTALNVTGDALFTLIIAKSEQCLDEAVYYDPEAGMIDEPTIDQAVEINDVMDIQDSGEIQGELLKKIHS